LSQESKNEPMSFPSKILLQIFSYNICDTLLKVLDLRAY
jgi:hypothetical protein